MPALATTRPSLMSNSSSRPWLRLFAIPFAATALVALCAHISLPLPFSPVPTTMQTFAVLLIGMLLGPLPGATALLLYLAEGAAGLPVFSPHGLGGLAQLTGPTAGYLLAYPVAALVAAWVYRISRRSLSPGPAALIAALLAELPIFLSGAGWLMLSLHLSAGHALAAGVAPFLLAEILKIAMLSLVLTSIERARRSR